MLKRELKERPIGVVIVVVLVLGLLGLAKIVDECDK